MTRINVTMGAVGAAQRAYDLDGLRRRPVLDGVRGAAPYDVDALVDLLMTLSRLVTVHADAIDEIDLNPVLLRRVGSDGPPVVAADALVVTAVEARPGLLV